MKLISHPTIILAFKQLMLEMPPATLDVEAEVPKEWLLRFGIVEHLLNHIGPTRTLESIKHALTWQQIGELYAHGATADEKLWDHVVEPQNESADWVITALGFSSEHVRVTKSVMDEFFDGELFGIFTDEVPHV